MKMNKTRLLEKISIQSGISADECSTVLKTFERVLGEELTRKTHRYWRVDTFVGCFVGIRSGF